MKTLPEIPELPVQPLYQYQTQEERAFYSYSWPKAISLPFSYSSFTRNNFSDMGKAENESVKCPRSSLGTGALFGIPYKKS